MTSNSPSSSRAAGTAHRGHAAGPFSMLFSSTPRGARLARHLAEQWLDAQGVPYGSVPHDALALITAELANNAARHGRVQGRDFRLALATVGAATVRVEVSDTRSERLPVPLVPASDCTTGRGLLLVDALASRWDWHPRAGAPGKTVWAEYDLASLRDVPPPPTSG